VNQRCEIAWALGSGCSSAKNDAITFGWPKVDIYTYIYMYLFIYIYIDPQVDDLSWSYHLCISWSFIPPSWHLAAKTCDIRSWCLGTARLVPSCTRPQDKVAPRNGYPTPMGDSKPYSNQTRERGNPLHDKIIHKKWTSNVEFSS
jgi:hypothetical protein